MTKQLITSETLMKSEEFIKDLQETILYYESAIRDTIRGEILTHQNSVIITIKEAESLITSFNFTMNYLKTNRSFNAIFSDIIIKLEPALFDVYKYYERLNISIIRSRDAN